MKAKFKNSTNIERTKPSVGGRRETVKASDLVEMLDWPKGGKSIAIRPVGPLAARGIHKIKVRKKDGTEVEIQKACLAFDPATDEKDSTKKCPYCKMPATLAKFSKLYFINAIVRPLQEDKPNKLKKFTKEEDTSGFKGIDSDSWTPVRVVRVPSSLALRFKQLGEKNIVKNKTGDKKAFPVMHEKYGFDLDVSFDKNLPAANMYSADRAEGPEGGRYSPLSEEEDGYLLWDTDPLYAPEEFAEAKKEAESLTTRWGGDEEGDDDDDDDDGAPRRKSSKSKSRDDDDGDDDEDDDDEDMDDEEEEKPTKKSSAKKPVKKSSKDDDEDDEDLDLDEDDDEDEDEDDEDDRPAKKSSKKPAAKSKRSSRDEDEDDEDEDDEDEDDEDEDDRPAKKSSAKKPVKKSSKRDDDDEDDEDDEDSDDLDDLDDEDEDEEEEKPAKKSSAKKPVNKAGRR